MEPELALECGYRNKPQRTTLLNSLFMSTLNMATKTLVSVGSNVRMERAEKWKIRDHLRFMMMLMTWITVWGLRFFMDHFPSVMKFSPHHLLLGRLSARLRSFTNNKKLLMHSPSSVSSVLSTSASSFDLLLQQDDFDGPSVQGLGRALTHVLALLNEIPASSRKYQFAMEMAMKIMDGNFNDGHAELMQVNRMALSSAFARTLSFLYRSLKQQQHSEEASTLEHVVKALPMGSYITNCVKGFTHIAKMMLHTVGKGSLELDRKRSYEDQDEVLTEKFAQELLWIADRLRAYGAVDEAMVQWSSATGLNSLSFTANPRVQCHIVKISALLLGELPSKKVEVSAQVKFGLLALWIPLFSHANNGLSYPFLTSFEKMYVEKAIEEAISTLPATDQEVILTNWLQDFTLSASEWPNLQQSYDRWCMCTRELADDDFTY